MPADETAEVDPTLANGEHEQPSEPIGPMVDGKPADPDLHATGRAPEPEQSEGGDQQ